MDPSRNLFKEAHALTLACHTALMSGRDLKEVLLEQDCNIQVILDALNEIQDKNLLDHENITQWKLDLLADVICWPGPRKDNIILENVGQHTNMRIARLINCLYAIPEYNVYKALVKAYAGVSPTSPRPNRSDDTPETISKPSAGDDFVRGKQFIMQPNRRNYILTGKNGFTSSTSNQLSPEAIIALRHIAVYIPEDLYRIDERDLTRSPDIKLSEIIEITQSNIWRETRY